MKNKTKIFRQSLGQSGFTLIEILIVVAIIGILAAIVLANIASSQKRSRMAEFKSIATSAQKAAVTKCDSVGTGNSGVVWTASPTGSLSPVNITCSNGEIAAGNSATSTASVTGATCVYSITKSGLVQTSAAGTC